MGHLFWTFYTFFDDRVIPPNDRRLYLGNDRSTLLGVTETFKSCGIAFVRAERVDEEITESDVSGTRALECRALVPL